MNPKPAPEVRRKRTVIGAILTLLLAGLSSSVFGQERTSLKTIRIGMPNRGVPNLGLMAAQRYGFFRAQGLDAELIVMRPSLSLQTLMAGDLDYSTVLASAARASVSGLPLRIIMTLTVGPDFSLVVRPDIRRVEDLKGKTLAVSGVGEFTDVGTRLLLKKYGLTPEVERQIASVIRQPSLALERPPSGTDRWHSDGDALQQNGGQNGV